MDLPSCASTLIPDRIAGRFSVLVVVVPGGLVGSVTTGVLRLEQNAVWIFMKQVLTVSLDEQAPGRTAGMVVRGTQALVEFCSNNVPAYELEQITPGLPGRIANGPVSQMPVPQPPVTAGSQRLPLFEQVAYEE